MIPSEQAKRFHDKLVEYHVTIAGNKPEDGGWTPNDKICQKLIDLEKRQGPQAIDMFLRASVCAHLSRTKKSHTPFFVNQHLFAESSLAYLKTHREYLEKLYGEAKDPNQFNKRVYADVIKAESDYLKLALHYRLAGKKLDWNIIVPTIFWVISSELFGRFDNIPAPAWIDMPVSYDGKKMRLGEARSLERKILRSNKARKMAVCSAAQKAMHNAAQGWAQQKGLITFFYNDFDQLSHIPQSLLDPALLRVTKPLINRDLELFDAAKKIWEAQGKTFKSPIELRKKSKSDDEAELAKRSQYADTLIDPVMQKMLEATEME